VAHLQTLESVVGAGFKPDPTAQAGKSASAIFCNSSKRGLFSEGESQAQVHHLGAKAVLQLRPVTAGNGQAVA
jgi:hypothetical protein